MSKLGGVFFTFCEDVARLVMVVSLNKSTARVLAVDLDGTLINSDLLLESALAAFRENPLVLFALPLWLMRGKAVLKAKLAELARLDIATLPWNDKILLWLREQRATGRYLVLATASDYRYAEAISLFLGCFNKVLATSSGINLCGEAKRRALVSEFGEGGFDYAGNSPDDLIVWRSAAGAILVNGGETLMRRVRCPVIRVFPRVKCEAIVWLKAARLHQWLKNLLLFLPLIAAHQLDLETLVTATLGFFIFGLCASSVYLLNDLLDLKADRQHPRKRLRPFAAGRIPLIYGLVAVPVMLVVSFAGAFALSPLFAGALLLYYALTLAYSLWLKSMATTDVATLAALYTLSVIAGAALTGIVPSFWLLAFALFFFLSLAFLKRYTELVDMVERNAEKSGGRDYDASDATLLGTQGVAAGYAAVLVLAFYVNSRDVTVLYKEPRWLWGICILLLFWLNRSWLRGHRGKLHDDPVIYAATDPVSLLTFSAIMALFAIASRSFF